MFVRYNSRKMNMIRFFSSSARTVRSTELAQLRKRTGFTLINCRKALQLNDNDLDKAEAWLQAESKKLGWEKANKVQNRIAAEGLIAITKTKNKVVMVEVNCETDFVAKNEKFVSLAQIVALSCLNYEVPQSDTHFKKNITRAELENLTTPNNEKMSDYIAQRIGEFGENIVLRRGISYELGKGIEVDIAVHPPVEVSKDILTGRYGAFVAYERFRQPSLNNQSDIPLENISKNLCKHIIALVPRTIGVQKEQLNEDENENQIESDIQYEEVELVNQEYLFNTDFTVGELVEAEGIRIVDFHRFQCGEDENKLDESINEEPPSESDAVKDEASSRNI